MEDPNRQKHEDARRRQSREFFERLHARRPEIAAAALERAKREAAVTDARPISGGTLESAFEVDAPSPTETVFETIVREERPVLFVQNDWINRADITLVGEEAIELVDAVEQHRPRLEPMMPLIGRIDVTNFPGLEFVGTGWLIAEDVVVTNRHVASLVAKQDGQRFAFSRGVGGKAISTVFCTAHEYDDLAPDAARSFAVTEVLYIEPESGPHDIAFLKIARQTDGVKRPFIAIAPGDAAPDTRVLVVGYPARAPKRVIPDQQLMRRLYRDRYDVKRAAPGYTMPSTDATGRHDCTTLGGNSGSVVLDLQTGNAVGLHFAGLYQESNFAVRASVLMDYVKRRRWLIPPVLEADRPSTASPRRSNNPGSGGGTPTPSPPSSPRQQPADGASVTITIPLRVTLMVGTPTVAEPVGPNAPAADPARGGDDAAATTRNLSAPRRVSLAAAEAAAQAFWDQRPDGVVAVRVGFIDDGGDIGDVPLIAASVPAGELARVRAVGPRRFQTLEVGYFPADVAEQIATLPELESVESISYDDAARMGEGFSFDPVDEEMVVTAHVGPEYSWEVLERFLSDNGKEGGELVSGMYEFHATHIADAIEARLDAGASLRLVLDNATFSPVRHTDTEFGRRERFEQWDQRFPKRFQRIVAPEGRNGLISDSYHIKVTVRDDDAFWLSSGNWKPGSSQPMITQEQRDHAAGTDLPGNREWHIVIQNKTLAERFRNHIEQDFARSRELGGGTLPAGRESLDAFVDIPPELLEEGIELERRPPGRLLEPASFTGKIKVRPLLTPDREGAVYSEAVLELIRSARESLFFQIPYISMPYSPRASRGFIDDLIKALTEKLKTLDDARVILRTGGNRFSAPTHAAWYFKSKGVDIPSRVRQLENHHTKGMIVDGKRVLIGSHNWSKPGVTLNRDASLLIDDTRIASYYAEAFEIDWARANPIKSRRYVEGASVLLETRGGAPPTGFRRVCLADLLKDAD